jgi:hypothetical protein
LYEVDDEREEEDEGEQPQGDADGDANEMRLLAHQATHVQKCEHLFFRPSLNYTAPAPSTMHPERTRETEKLEELMLAPTSN